MFSLHYVFCNNCYFLFSILVLIAPVPVIAYSFTFYYSPKEDFILVCRYLNHKEWFGQVALVSRINHKGIYDYHVYLSAKETHIFQTRCNISRRLIIVA